MGELLLRDTRKLLFYVSAGKRAIGAQSRRAPDYGGRCDGPLPFDSVTAPVEEL
jgi:hypothetical protein